MKTTSWLIWFSLMLIIGFYVRHWSRTGVGQFRRLEAIFNK